MSLALAHSEIVRARTRKISSAGSPEGAATLRAAAEIVRVRAPGFCSSCRFSSSYFSIIIPKLQIFIGNLRFCLILRGFQVLPV